MKSILDRCFRYVPARETDVRKTFERIRKEREGAQRREVPAVVHLSREENSLFFLMELPR